MTYLEKSYLLYLDYMKYFQKQLFIIFGLHEVFRKNYPLYLNYEVFPKTIIHYVWITSISKRKINQI